MIIVVSFLLFIIGRKLISLTNLFNFNYFLEIQAICNLF